MTSRVVVAYILFFFGGSLGLHHIVTRRYGRLVAFIVLDFFIFLFQFKFIGYILFFILSLMWFYDLFTLPSQVRRSMGREAPRRARRSVRRVERAFASVRRTTPSPEDVPPVVDNPIPPPDDLVSHKKKKKKRSRFEIIDEEIED